MPGLTVVSATISTLVAAVLFTYQCPNGTCLSGSKLPLHRVLTYPWAGNQDWNILYHLGGNGPWIPKVSGVVDSGIDAPHGCRIDQVHMISRHAERYPTIKAGTRMLQFYHRLINSQVVFNGSLSFVNTWNFFMPDPAARLEGLIPVGPYAGTLEAFSTGVKLRTRYEHLLQQALARNQTNLWASGSARVEATAHYFAAGLYGIDWTSIATLNVIPETSDLGANTLTPGDTCLAYRDPSSTKGHDYGYQRLAEWQSVYIPPIARRLAEIAPAYPFSFSEIYIMQEICGFETLSTGSTSPWCDVFTHTELEQFEYARDLLHFYRSGPGNPFGGSIGWLFLNATKDLLVQGPDVAGPLFFSFVHDGDIIPFLAALDLFPQSQELSSDHEKMNRTWRTSDVTPMGGRVVLERLARPKQQTCWSNEPYYPNHIYCDDPGDEYFVRILVNDGVVPLHGCDSGPGQSCPLDKFVEHVDRRGRETGDFRELCGLGKEAAERITFLEQPVYNQT